MVVNDNDNKHADERERECRYRTGGGKMRMYPLPAQSKFTNSTEIWMENSPNTISTFHFITQTLADGSRGGSSGCKLISPKSNAEST